MTPSLFTLESLKIAKYFLQILQIGFRSSYPKIQTVYKKMNNNFFKKSKGISINVFATFIPLLQFTLLIYDFIGTSTVIALFILIDFLHQNIM